MTEPVSPTPSAEVKIQRDDLHGAQIAELLSEHLEALMKVTPTGSMHALDLDALRKSEITFWSAWVGHEIAGCGALKELASTHGEIKSMRTAKSHLRKGVAASILAEIIAEATRRGYHRLSLETGAGDYFRPAHHLYRKFGFQDCGPFADYVEDRNSIFMTRELLNAE